MTATTFLKKSMMRLTQVHGDSQEAVEKRKTKKSHHRNMLCTSVLVKCAKTGFVPYAHEISPPLLPPS